MNRSTLKKEIIISHVELTKKLNENNVVLLTSAGLIEGTPVNMETDIPKDDDAKLDITACISYLVKELELSYFKENKILDENQLDNNDGFFILKDVKISMNGTKVFIPVLTVFYDQIVAISVGNTNK